MQRLRDGQHWSVFDPNDVPSLHTLGSSDFTAAYVEYETRGLGLRVYNPNDIWVAVTDSQRETGTPFIVFQDNANGE